MKFFVAIALGLYVLLVPGLIYAEQTTIRQRILPADCIFDVIEVGGVQQFNFYTPEACGVDIPDPPIDNPGEETGGNTANDPLTLLRRGGEITVTEVVTDTEDDQPITNKDTNIEINDRPLSQDINQDEKGNSFTKTVAVVGGILITVGAMAYVGTIILSKNGIMLFGDDPDSDKDDNQTIQ